MDDDNNIVVAGCNEDSGVLALARFTPNGGLDGTFGSGGIVTESFACQANAVAIDNDGNIVVSGLAANGENLVVARFTTDGDLDDTFGPSEGCSMVRATPTTSSIRPAQSVQLSPSSSDPMGYKILLVGSSVRARLRERGGAVQLNGTPDTTF